MINPLLQPVHCLAGYAACVQGNIAAWRKQEGDSLAPGDILAEVETDKATIEWESQEEGFIAKIIKPAGQGRQRDAQ